MAETGAVRFPGSLDPAAQEFRPGFTNAVDPIQIPFVRPLPLYYSYGPQTVTFYDGSVSYGPQYYDPVRAAAQATYVAVPQQPALPPPTAAATRVLLLTSVGVDVSETTVRRELEVFGEVRGVQMEILRDGIVTVHFYDLRAAERALREIREQHMQQQSRLRNFFAAALMAADSSAAEANAYPPVPPPARGLIAGRTVWAHFIVPGSNAVPDGNNQGTIVVFNLDPGVSSAMLKEIFQAFGPVKELRETPLKKHQRFIEFYDVRDAAKALREMNGKEINGRQIVIEFSRPGGYSKKFYNYANNAAAFTTLPAINDYSRNTKYRSPPSPQSQLSPKFPGRFTTNIPRAFLSRGESFSKKSTYYSKGNPNGSCSVESSIEASTCSNGCEAKVRNIAGERNNGKKSRATVSKAHHPKNRPWKGKQVKKYDDRFLISEESMNESSCRDSRTTVMIRNIPNKYSQKLLLSMLDNHCIHCNEQIGEGDAHQPLSSYDFVYLPIDFNNKCNVGYGFVNMTSPEATWRLYKAFHHQNWEVFNSRKICEVTYARVQGLEALKEHFRNSKFPCEMEHYLPVVFSPPRDGKQLSDPQTIVGQRQQLRSTSCSISSAQSSQQGTVEEDEAASDGGGDCSGGGGGDDDEDDRVG